MRKASSVLLAIALALASGVARASTEPISTRLDKAKQAKAEAEAALASAERRLADITQEYGRVRADLEAAASEVDSSYLAGLSVSAELAAAQSELDRRASQIFEAGVGAPIDAFLSSESLADLGFVQEFAARALSIDEEAVARVSAARASLEALTRKLERRQTKLRASAARLQELSDEAAAEVAGAESVAGKAGLAVRDLEEEERALEEIGRASCRERVYVLV